MNKTGIDKAVRYVYNSDCKKNNLRGGVKFSTGGKAAQSADESANINYVIYAECGQIPQPTVKVRMKEVDFCFKRRFCAVNKQICLEIML